MNTTARTLISSAIGLLVSAAGWSQATIVVDDGIEFPDSTVQSASAGVAQTGQMKCYNLSGTADEITCFETAQDGNLRKGYKWLSPRFAINGDGTVTDTFTGLMWLQDANCIGGQYPGFDNDATVGDGFVSWDHAFEFVAGMNLGTYAGCNAGQSDWRVPNFNEMLSLVHYAYTNPALCNTSCLLQWKDGDPFTNLTVDATYWTSTSRPTAPTWSWAVDIGTAAPTSSIKVASPDRPVWPVRDAGDAAATGSATLVIGDGGIRFDDGGVQDTAVVGPLPQVVLQTGQTKCFQTDGTEIDCLGTGQDGEFQNGAEWPVPRFTDNGDETVTDNLTGLVWLKNADCAGVPGWVDAMSFGNYLWDGSTLIGGGDCNLSDGSKQGDWRLPSLRELMSLIDSEYGNPAMSNSQGDGQWMAEDPFTNVHSNIYYWTSTTSEDDPTQAFAVHFGIGNADPQFKTDSSLTAWVVRNGH